MSDGMTPAQRAAIIRHCLPGIASLGKEMRARLFVETNKDSGELAQNSYAAVDDVTGELEVGYDESDSLKPHGFYYIFGTSKNEGDPAIQRVVYGRYRARRGDGS